MCGVARAQRVIDDAANIMVTLEGKREEGGGGGGD